MEIIISFCAVLQSLVDGHFLISTNTKFPIFLWSRTISVRGGSRIYKRGGLTQGTNLLGRDVRSMLELGGSGGMPPQENFEKWMLKYCNLETFPHKIHNIFCL